MKIKRLLLCLLMICAVLLTGCSEDKSGSSAPSRAETPSSSASREQTDEESQAEPKAVAALEKIDMTKWQYNADADAYWQVGISYCAEPADESYEYLGVFVPGAYFDGTDNGDGFYTCTVNAAGTVGGFTAETAPMVLPVDTPGYAAMAAPTGYDNSTAAYTAAGFIYIYAGCRGRDAGAPAGVTDLKAAIRYVRYNEDILPGSTDRIFSFGMSGGGAQSALIGATGDSALYTPYLEEIGAVSETSDAVAGSMCWCPITNLDYASEAYEWNLGVTRTDLSDELQALSDGMAERFAQYINELGLTDGNGDPLLLTASEEGVYQAGSYYDYLKGVIEGSLNNFLADTEFPYTAASAGKGGFGEMVGFGGPDGFGDLPEGGPDGQLDGKGGKEGFGKGEGFDGGGFPGGPDGGKGDLPDQDGEMPDIGGIEERDGIDRNEVSGGVSLSGTYETAQDYIDALNAEKVWVSYDAASNTASITSIADFVSALKLASKDLGAFDALDESQGENILFGYGDGQGAHFDAVMAELLKDDSEYGAAYAEDLTRTDALGTSVADRVNMYNPLYYLCEYYGGYQTANVAQNWRIRTGINQSDTALTTEVDLALALEAYGAQVDFETVWGQAHVEAERTGNSTENFIAWVAECCGE